MSQFFPVIASKVHKSEIDSQAAKLERDGYLIIRGAADRPLIEHLNQITRQRFERTPFSKGNFYGECTKRFGQLLTRAPASAELVQHSEIMDIVQRVLVKEGGEIQLNLTQALEMHPGSISQVPHRDDSIWDCPKPVEFSINVMWPFTEYTRENGATNLWPGSNHHEEVLLPEEDSLDIEMEPGDALLYVGSILHRGGHNSSHMVRRGMIVGYCLGWLKPYENQWLAYPPVVARNFPEPLARLVGYRQDQPNLNNYDGQCPSLLLRGDPVPEFLGAIDELRPDQVAMIDDYRAGKLVLA
jgi:ectoine hydroxylase-related dioxygenase (phytanoyl-CoA dioxygenase family)